MYRATVKTNNSVKQYIGATEGTIKQGIYNPKLSFTNRNYSINTSLFIHTHLAPKRHEYLNHHHLGNTKTSTLLQQDIKEKPVIITHPSQNTLLNKKLEIQFKCRYENKHLLSHLTHTHNPSTILSLLKIPLTPTQIT